VENEDKLKSAFIKTIGVLPGCDFNSLEYSKTEGWDSIAHMALIAAIEEEFDIMLETDDVIAMNSYPLAKEILKKYEVALA